MSFFRRAKYRYSVLTFKRSLHDNSQPQPIAVILEGAEAVYILGTDVKEAENLSDLGQAVVKALPAALRNELREAERARGRSEGSLIERLAVMNPWNLAFSPLREWKEDVPIHEAAFALFARYVAEAPQWSETVPLPTFQVSAPAHAIA